MPVSLLNNAGLTDAYTDSNTVEFGYARPSFSAQVANNSVYYTLAYILPGQRAVTWSVSEHYHVQALLTFNDPEGEGLPPGSKFGGIKLRNGAAGKTARVSVT